MLPGHITYQNVNNFSYKLKCKERRIRAYTLLFFMCAMKNQILAGRVTAQRVFVVVLTNYVVDLTIPLVCSLLQMYYIKKVPWMLT